VLGLKKRALDSGLRDQQFTISATEPRETARAKTSAQLPRPIVARRTFVLIGPTSDSVETPPWRHFRLGPAGDLDEPE
jgi:hypothetical protein